MKLVKPSTSVMTMQGYLDTNNKLIEIAGRACYHSEDKITDDSEKRFISNLIHRGHTSVLEHSLVVVKFTISRAVANEIVRHRHCGFSQESTRYCNYTKKKFGGELTFIEPLWWNDPLAGESREMFTEDLESIEETYTKSVEEGILTAEEARDILPLCLKTDLIVSASYREWREIFRLRCATDAHPEIRRVMIPLRDELNNMTHGVVFGDLC